jgi:hypothetical protein
MKTITVNAPSIDLTAPDMLWLYGVAWVVAAVWLAYKACR